jgi:hypothetical protein
MDISAILAELHEQREKIQQAIDALQGVCGTSTAKRRGARPGRVMSAEARRRIGLAMKKRWAERKKAEKKAA